MNKRITMTIVFLAAFMVIPIGLFAARSDEGLGIRLGLGNLTDSDIRSVTKTPIFLWADYDMKLPSVPDVTIRPNLGVVYIGGKDDESYTATMIPLMVDGVYHINQPGMQIKPYVGAGIGFVYIDYTAKYRYWNTYYGEYRWRDYGDTETDFCYNLIGGAEYPLSPTTGLVGQLDLWGFSSDVFDTKMISISVGYKIRY
jgi:hypothetical protein